MPFEWFNVCIWLFELFVVPLSLDKSSSRLLRASSDVFDEAGEDVFYIINPLNRL